MRHSERAGSGDGAQGPQGLCRFGEEGGEHEGNPHVEREGPRAHKPLGPAVPSRTDGAVEGTSPCFPETPASEVSRVPTLALSSMDVALPASHSLALQSLRVKGTRNNHQGLWDGTRVPNQGRAWRFPRTSGTSRRPLSDSVADRLMPQPASTGSWCRKSTRLLCVRGCGGADVT